MRVLWPENVENYKLTHFHIPELKETVCKEAEPSAGIGILVFIASKMYFLLSCTHTHHLALILADNKVLVYT